MPKGTLFILVRRFVYSFLFILDKIFGREAELVVLCYHSISEDDWRFGVTETMFMRQMDLLISKGYSFVSFLELKALLEGGNPLPRKSVLVTFDDGYKDVLRVKDWLRAHGIRPMMFVLSDSASSDTDELGTRKELLSLEDIRSLQSAGWEIGCHSATHADFSNLDAADLFRETSGAKRMLESMLGFPIESFAYPKGFHSPAIVEQVRKAGFKIAFSMDDKPVDSSSNPLAVSRVGVDRTHSLWEFPMIFSPSVVMFRNFVKTWFGWR